MASFWDNMPCSLLALVFECCKPKEVFHCLRLVCARWSRTGGSWSSVHLADLCRWGDLLKATSVKHLTCGIIIGDADVSFCTNLQSLTLKNTCESQLTSLLANLPLLVCLRIPNFPLSPTVANAVAGLEHLRELVAASVFSQELVLVLRRLAELEILAVNWMDVDLRCLEGMTRLRELRILTPSLCEVSAPMPALPNLHVLELHLRSRSKRWIQTLLADCMPTLRALTLGVDPTQFDKLYPSVRSSRAIFYSNRIRLTWERTCQALPLDNLFGWPLQLTQIDAEAHHLASADAPFVERLSVFSIDFCSLSSLVKLKSLIVRDVWNISDLAAARRSFQRLTSLHTLHLYCCSANGHPEHEQDLALISELASLENLVFEPRRLTVPDMKLLAQMPKLRDLRIQACEPDAYACFRELEALRTLAIGRVAAEDVVLLSHSCPQVTDLTLRMITDPRGYHVSLVSQLPGLKPLFKREIALRLPGSLFRDAFRRLAPEDRAQLVALI